MILLFFVLILITGCKSYNKIKKNNPVFEDNLSIYTDYNDPKLIEWRVDIPFHRKFLSINKNREAVIGKVNEIYKNYINSYTISERSKLYRPIVEPIIISPPDSENLPYKIWESSFTGLPKHIDEVAKDPEINNTIIEFTDLSEEDLHITSWGEINFDTKKSLEPGVYYLKVVAKVKDHPSYYQIAMDDCYVNHKTYYGVRKIEIK